MSISSYALKPEFATGLGKRLVMPAAVLLISGCGALPERNGFLIGSDGAPRHNIDVAAIADAEPQIVPRSRYGNPASYVVNGKRYHVMATSTAFEQQGTASWYGTKFHGRKTSSGEPYDMFAMTAAHKSLPLPTWVEVTNQANHKRIIVKVNDRGPFVSDRILDLSYAAAAKLGIIATGTAPVKIRAIDPAQYLARKNRPVTDKSHATAAASIAPPPAVATTNIAPPPAVATASIAPPSVVANTGATQTSNNSPAALNTSGFYLQIAAFNDRQNAEQLRQRLLALHTGAIEINPAQRSGANLYRVRIGPLTSLTEAGKVASLLSSLGLGEPKILLD